MPRKTISIDRVREVLNAGMARKNEDIRLPGYVRTPEDAYRMALASVAEVLLMEADAYRGFGYLEEEQVPITDETGMVRGHRPRNETRRCYYHD